MAKEKYYITTAIAYTSGKPHIGNTYEAVLADAIARFKRQEGYDVFFQTGTDEHGQKIEMKAQEAGVTPQKFVDGVASQIKSIWDLMNTSYDKFIRTTDDYHERQVQKIFKKLYEQGDIYKGHYEGMYCTPCESFFTESQLVDGKCPDCGRPVTPAKEEAYFFRMSKYADRLIEHINTHPEFIQPVSRKNEMMNNFLLPGLQDLCVSRTSFKWGIPVDFDPDHVVYVWLDALTNYITGIGYDCDGESTEQFKKDWPADLHLIGKDIIRFHTIYWPIFLMALGLPLPKQVFGHPWLLQGDGKMSKSKGNVIYADELVDFFGVDAVRYFVLHEMPFENDGVITWELMVERLNSELANTLGNLVNRTISMSNKYFGGVVADKGVAEPVDEALKAFVLEVPKKVVAKMDELRVADAMTEVFSLFKRCNKYIDETMPWALAKDESKQDRLATVLYNLVEGICIGATLLQSFMPDTTGRILGQLNAKERSMDDLKNFGLYPSGNKVTDKPEILFARLDVKEVLKKVEELHPPVQEEEKSNEKVIDIEAKSEVTFEDFEKLQFQVGEIIACEEVKKSRKLLCSKVKIGSQVRQIVSGIKSNYSAQEMIGKKVMVLVNLKPAKLAGILSEGMILCAEDENGNLSLVTPEKEMPAGAEIC
ncbi:methionine--tRNA ligase [Blautia hydrogenotrophica]|nr:methionine--tRNA ligase [Blautia hydrogenotrophica]SCH47245.1 Methionine--tRNA ligase [uncultured Blautia sp.]MCT6797536.1 methionine--tRNA ligase [Blautia hydrogenotrophica]MEE0461878.1 methionine--tRNA ligase [Blautia hydrogenotrophica]WPX85054.1 Methionine--tRNA ligase [Blautia hydrogenotrophica DSM 10507]CCX58446.1 methionine--tRNA ligase [Blautia hydrogenotrophica CAG:147]